MKTLVYEDRKVIAISGNCQYGSCDKPATHIAYDRDRQEVEFYCDSHAETVVEYDRPEYHECCPNCGCEFGVN